MADREEREKVIEILQKEKKTALHDNRWAFDYAINSIKTDLKYDLLYEETSEQADKPTTPNDCETCIHNKGVLECDMYGCKYEPTTKKDLAVDAVSRQAINGYIDYIFSHGMGKKKSFDSIKKFVAKLPSVTPQEPRKGEWLRMSDLSEQEDYRYKCSRCGNVINHKSKMDLYTFNSWCGRCGSDNGRKIEVTV